MANFIREIMKHEITTCHLDTSFKEVCKLIIDEDAKVVVVLNEMDEACGAITAMDIVRHLNENLLKLTAEDIMSFPIETVDPELWINEAGVLMAKKNTNYLVIMHGISLQPLKPVGYITTKDVIENAISKTN